MNPDEKVTEADLDEVIAEVENIDIPEEVPTDPSSLDLFDSEIASLWQ